MARVRRSLAFLTPLCLFAFFAGSLWAAQESGAGTEYPPSLLEGLHWRDVGPMRGGRTYGVAGTPASPIRSISARWAAAFGRRKTPAAPGSRFPMKAFRSAPSARLPLAPSNPNIVYVGTGEPDIRSQHSYGIGMFKSTDAGKTWTHIGLEGDAPDRTRGGRPGEPESRLRSGARPRL